MILIFNFLTIVIRQSNRNMKKLCPFRSQEGENRPPSLKTEFRAQNQYGRVIYQSIGNFTWSKKKSTFGGQKIEKNLKSPKTEFGAQNQYGRVIYPSIENFTWSKKKYFFFGSKRQK
jgi:hypothetical protein